jgi:hypothetical protein
MLIVFLENIQKFNMFEKSKTKTFYILHQLRDVLRKWYDSTLLESSVNSG